MCTVCVSDGCSEVVTYVFPVDHGLCHHQLVNRRPSAMESKRMKKRCAEAVRERCLPGAETDTRVKDINSAGDVNEK